MAEKSAGLSAPTQKPKSHRRSLSQPTELTSPTLGAAPKPLELHLKPIKLANAYHDSPMFRKSLKKEQDHATEIGGALKSYTKCLRTVHQTGTHHSQIMSSMTTDAQLLLRRINPISADPDDFDTEQQFQLFNQTIQLGENLRSDLLRQFEDLAIKPLEFLQEDVSLMHESSRKYQRLSSLADASAIKVAGLKKNSNKLDEAEAELADLKRQTSSAAIELGTLVNTFAAKRRLVVVDSACRFLELQKTYLEDYTRLIKDCLPQLQESRQKIRASLDALPSAVQALPLAVLQDATVAGHLQGYLYRKSKMGFTKRAYFILENGLLSCYEDSESENYEQPKWKMDMLTSTVKPATDANRNHCFEVISPSKSRTLQADSHETMTKWITAITQSISAQLDKQRIARPGRRGSRGASNKSGVQSSSISPSSSYTTHQGASHMYSSGPASSTAGHLAANGQPLSSSPSALLNQLGISEETDEDLKKREKSIRELYEVDEGNRFCADCSDPKPIWISLNLGILICLECSGIHRSMGTHISKVRSLTLDTLQHETQLLLMAIGNRVSNEVYGPDPLTAIPNSFGERLHPSSTRKDRESWIKAKYAEKIFVETYRGVNIQLELCAAIRAHDLPRVILLHAQGANLNFKYESDYGRTPLHYAADGEDSLIILYLLQNSALVGTKDTLGMTPLHMAAAGSVACAAMLCKHRAKVDVQDKSGKTPLDVALDSQNADAITLFRLAKLASDGNAGFDEKSFAEALDGFTLDIQTRSAKQASQSRSGSGWSFGRDSPAISIKGSMDDQIKKTDSSDTDSTSQTSDFNDSIRVSSDSSSHATSAPIPVVRSIHAAEAAVGPRSASPNTATSSFSFSSKLDTKRR